MKIYGKVKAIVPLYKAPIETEENLEFIRRNNSELNICGIVNDGKYQFWKEHLLDTGLVDDLVVNDENSVYRAWNLGVEVSKSQGFDFTFIFSNDTIFTKNCVYNLMSAAHKEQAMYCCSQYFENLPDSFQEPKATLEEFLVQDLKSLTRKITLTKETHFSAFLVNNNLFDRLGRFNESFKIYMGDIDFAYTMIVTGYPFYTNKSALVYHKNKTHLFSPSVRSHDLTEFVDIIANDAEVLYVNHKEHWDKFCMEVAKIMQVDIKWPLKAGYFDKELYKSIEKDYRLMACLR